MSTRINGPATIRNDTLHPMTIGDVTIAPGETRTVGAEGLAISSVPPMGEVPARKPRGFAAMKLKDPDLVKRLAAKGGKKAHELGLAHRFTPEEAQAAGQKGGRSTHAKRRERAERGSTT